SPILGVGQEAGAEDRADAAPLEARLDLDVRHDEPAVLEPVGGVPDHLAVADELVAALARVVAHVDLRRGRVREQLARDVGLPRLAMLGVPLAMLARERRR